jgi:hypothetical protein
LLGHEQLIVPTSVMPSGVEHFPIVDART